MDELQRTSRLVGLRTAAVALVAMVFLTSGGLATAPTASAAAALCKVDPERPHGSAHIGGTINAIGSVIRCLGDPVGDLHLDVQLMRFRDGVWRVVPSTRKVLRPAGRLIRISRHRLCTPGVYRSRLRIFGFGEHWAWHYSAPSLITCAGESGGGSGGGGGGGW